ncbi:MAG: hypothetical protein AAGU11_17845, partial [Syntrophobacteraceae bacterium]
MKTTLYTLEFHRADCPPDVDTEVLCTDGETVQPGYYDDSDPEIPPWRYQDGSLWPDVKAWTEPPDPNECMADCYPDRACRECGCTQDHGCEGGCCWV